MLTQEQWDQNQGGAMKAERADNESSELRLDVRGRIFGIEPDHDERSDPNAEQQSHDEAQDQRQSPRFFRQHGGQLSPASAALTMEKISRLVLLCARLYAAHLTCLRSAGPGQRWIDRKFRTIRKIHRAWPQSDHSPLRGLRIHIRGKPK